MSTWVASKEGGLVLGTQGFLPNQMLEEKTEEELAVTLDAVNVYFKYSNDPSSNSLEGSPLPTVLGEGWTSELRVWSPNLWLAGQILFTFFLFIYLQKEKNYIPQLPFATSPLTKLSNNAVRKDELQTVWPTAHKHPNSSISFNIQKGSLVFIGQTK